jgi:hypothetical protein
MLRAGRSLWSVVWEGSSSRASGLPTGGSCGPAAAAAWRAHRPSCGARSAAKSAPTRRPERIFQLASARTVNWQDRGLRSTHERGRATLAGHRDRERFGDPRRRRPILGPRRGDRGAPMDGDAAAGGGFSVERFGAAGEVDAVVAAVTVHAPSSAAAEAATRSLFAVALPTVAFTTVLAEPLTAAHVATYRATQAPATTPRR